MLEMLILLIYLVFMFGVPVTTERVWIDSIRSAELARKQALATKVMIGTTGA